MKSAMENLSKIGAEFYAEAQKAAAAGGGTPPPAEEPAGKAEGRKSEKKADVVDADFEVVDEDKKK
jgi:molecular chaperone DnaK